MKRIIITCLLSVSSLLIIEYFYIQSSSKSHLTQLISSLKDDSSTLNNKVRQTPTKESITKDIKVVDVKTGFYAGNLWYPSIIVRFKNKSEDDIKHYIEAKAIFIDSKTNEQIGVHSRYLSSSRSFFLQGTFLKKQFKSDIGYRGGLSSNTKIIVKLYLGDELIETYSIKNKQI